MFAQWIQGPKIVPSEALQRKLTNLIMNFTPFLRSECTIQHTVNWADNGADNWVDNGADNRVDNWADNRADNRAGNRADNQVDNQMQKK